MSDAIITVEGLGKKYRLGAGRSNERYTALRDVVAEAAMKPFRALGAKVGKWKSDNESEPSHSSKPEEFWALKDVSFEVEQGEVLGIIGRNGAGKSTLLKILSRITEPTEGQIKIKGRVASLLEVGTGFHPELTGRENIFLNGAILGMHRHEIKAKFDEIVAFAEVEKFLDTPVKRYSSGMYVRLAFAVAAHLEPEILVVDEVLAVGDAEFQKKCLGKMKDVSRGGRTVLFVSHNMAAVQSLCSEAVYLKSGSVAGAGKVETQIRTYLHEALLSDEQRMFPMRLSSEITLEEFAIIPRQAVSGEAVQLRICLRSEKKNKANEMAILLYSEQGVRVAIIDLRSQHIDLSIAPGEPLSLAGYIEALNLVEGTYVLGLYLVCGDCSGDFFDLLSVRVVGSKERGGGSVYPANVRGYLELDYKFSLREVSPSPGSPQQAAPAPSAER